MDKVEKVYAVYPVGTYKQQTIDALESQGYSVLDINHTKFSHMYDSNGNIDIGISTRNGGTPFKKKNYKFPQNYVDFICANMNSYDVIMVSTNKETLKELAKRGVAVKTILPSSELNKEKLIQLIRAEKCNWSYVRDQIENYQKYIDDVIKNVDLKYGFITLKEEDPEVLELYHTIINKTSF